MGAPSFCGYVREHHKLFRLQLRNARGLNCEINVLVVDYPDGDHTDYLYFEIEKRTAAIPVRHRRGNLNYLSQIGYFTHCGDNPVADRAFESQRVADYKNLFAVFRQQGRGLQGPHALSRDFHAKQREVSFIVHTQYAGNGIDSSFAIEGSNLRAVGAANDMQISQHLFRV